MYHDDTFLLRIMHMTVPKNLKPTRAAHQTYRDEPDSDRLSRDKASPLRLLYILERTGWLSGNTTQQVQLKCYLHLFK